MKHNEKKSICHAESPIGVEDRLVSASRSVAATLRFRIKFGMTILFVCAVILAGCTAASIAPVTKEIYTAVFAEGVCAAVTELNTAGAWQDVDMIADAIEAGVRDAAAAHGITAEKWRTARQTFFTADEHEKMMKMNFSACLIDWEKLPTE